MTLTRIGVLVFSVILLIVSLVSLCCEGRVFIATGTIVIINIYLALMLFASCLKSDGKSPPLWLTDLLPKSIDGMAVFLTLFATIVFSFARVYESHGIAEFNCEANEIKFNSIYTSLGTLTTVSQGEFKAESIRAKKDVMYEIITMLNLIFCALPLLTSRIASENKKG